MIAPAHIKAMGNWVRTRAGGQGGLRSVLADERGESDPTSMLAGLILAGFVMVMLSMAFSQALGAGGHTSAEQAAVEALQADATAWQTEPYSATDHAVTASPVSSSVTISKLPVTVWRSVTTDSSGVLTGVWSMSRAGLGVKGVPADTACAAGMNAPASDCLVVSTVSYPAATDQLPPTPAGVTLGTKAARRGVRVATLSISQMQTAGALDLRLAVKPSTSVTAAELSNWRASLVCANGTALTSSTPDSALSPEVGGWSNARITVANATSACATDSAQIVLWATGATQPTTAQITSGGVHIYRIGGAKQ